MTANMLLSDMMMGIRRRRTKQKRILTAERSFHLATLDLAPGCIAIDCGANVGVYTRYLARSGATVYAFEPDPTAFALLSENTKMLPNVIAIQAAVGTRDGEMLLFRSQNIHQDPARHSVESTVVPTADMSANYDTVQVKSISLTRFIDELPSPVSLLKMDIEGMEVDLLEQLLESGRASKIVRAFVETHERTHPDLRARTFQLIRRVSKERPHWNLDWA